MSKIEIRVIDAEHQRDIRIPNHPFPLFGRMIPSYINEKWDYTVERCPADEVSQMCFPDEEYDFESMSQNTVFLGAYDGQICVGLAILQDGFFRYMHLYDLKVNAEYRRQGVGELLIKSAEKIAGQKKYRGIFLECQDNNLGAALFYLKCGFRIGGLDTEVYGGTSQEGKADILFYLSGSQVSDGDKCSATDIMA